MWTYQKRLQFPVKILRPNATEAKVILEQFGGPDGELGAANRYLSQRFTAPYDEVKAILTDIGTEELSHVEMVCTLVHQLTRNLTIDEIKEQGFSDYFVEHTVGLYPCSASGGPFNALAFASKGDVITDLSEDMAAEQKARTTYDNILRLCDDPDVRNVIKYLRQREIVHYQRFGESLRVVQEKLNSKNYYAFNPSFDRVE